MKVLMESWRKYLKEAEEFVPKIDNRGDVAEGLLGAALVARYLKSAEEDSNVTEKDIENVLDQLNGTDAIPIMKKDWLRSNWQSKKSVEVISA